jgi:hypothetical protein
MAEAKFTYGEMISHGWEMTKKHWIVILLISVIYLSFAFAKEGLHSLAGSDYIRSREARELYKDSAMADKFYKYLQEVGYINKFGGVQDKLQRLASYRDLELSPDFENKRHGIYSFLNKYRYRLPFSKPVYYVISLTFWIISILLGIGLAKSYLQISRDEEPDIFELFNNWRLLIPYVLGAICYGLAVFGGLLLLIIPGIILMIAFQFWFYLVIDKGLGPIAALKRSRQITKGSKWQLAVLGFLLLLINIGGLLCLVIGLFFTISISYIAMAHVYDRLEETQIS